MGVQKHREGGAEDDGDGKVRGDNTATKKVRGGRRRQKGKMGADSSNDKESKRETMAAIGRTYSRSR